MARTGPRPKPLEQRELEGRTGHKVQDKSSAGEINKHTIVVLAEPVSEIPPPPDYLLVGRRGRRVWRMYWKEAHWLTLADYEAVGRVCMLIDHIDAMLEHFETNGIFQTDKSGSLVASSAYGQYLRAVRELSLVEDRLGLNPVERNRIRIEQKKQGSPLDAWRERRQQRIQG